MRVCVVLVVCVRARPLACAFFVRLSFNTVHLIITPFRFYFLGFHHDLFQVRGQCTESNRHQICPERPVHWAPRGQLDPGVICRASTQNQSIRAPLLIPPLRKGTRIEIYTLTPNGLKPTLEFSIHGIIAALDLYRPAVRFPSSHRIGPCLTRLFVRTTTKPRSLC